MHSPIPRRSPALLALAFLLSAPPAAAQEGDPPFLEVNGTGTASVPADRAEIAFAVETEADSAQQAVRRNAERMEAVLAALRALDLDLQIETFGYDLQPRYSRSAPEARPQGGGAPRIDGYRALNNVRVTTGEVEALGRIIDAAVSAGANRVASLSFEAEDTGAARAEALQEAVEHAARQARTIADALGVELGPPLEVRGGADMPQPVMMRQMMAEQAAPNTPIEPGEQVVTANVTIRYRLGGG